MAKKATPSKPESKTYYSPSAGYRTGLLGEVVCFTPLADKIGSYYTTSDPAEQAVLDADCDNCEFITLDPSKFKPKKVAYRRGVTVVQEIQ